ncbi:MAG: hypothetical protein WA418_24545 [Bradyrhizobium sp.]
MGAIKDLWQSERGLVAVALIAAASVLCGIGAVPVDQWLAYTKWIFVAYAAAKTVTGAVAMTTSGPTAESTASTDAKWRAVESLINSVMAGSAFAAGKQAPPPTNGAPPSTPTPEPTPPVPPVAPSPVTPIKAAA